MITRPPSLTVGPRYNSPTRSARLDPSASPPPHALKTRDSNRRAAWLAFLGFAVLLTPSAQAGFTDVTEQTPFSGLEQLPPNALDEQTRYVVRGGTPVVMDYDDDGWLDVYVVRYGLPDVLFHNQEGVFTRIDNPFGLTSNAGNMPAWADFDNDGDNDLFVATVGSNRYELHINQGGGVFTEQAGPRGVALQSIQPHLGAGVAVGDVNLDGYLDIVVGDWGVAVDETTRLQHYALFLNKGAAAPGYFENVTAEAGYHFPFPEVNFYAPTISDLDGDGWPDLPTVADFRRSRLFWNNGNGTFIDATATAGVSLEENGMGTAIGDINRDGLLDWFVTSIRFEGYPGYFGNQLYINQGNRRFLSVSDEATSQVATAGWGWGTNFFDYDNDGRLDIVMTNGVNDPLAEDASGEPLFAPMRLWQNLSSESGTVLSDVSDSQGVNYVGNGSGIVTFDYDNDGDLDILVMHQDATPRLLRNNLEGSARWLRLKLVGTHSNRNAIGTRVTLEATLGGPVQTAEYNPTNSYLAQLEPRLHFGVGATSTIQRLTIRWPDGVEQTLSNIATNQELTVTQTGDAPTAPIVTLNPVGGTFTKDSDVVLTASATGQPAPVYVWLKNEQPFPGATGPTLRLHRILPQDAGSYRVQAINPGGRVTSLPAVVQVDIDPELHSVARWWNEFLLDGIRLDFPNPPVHARNLFHLSAAMWDAFWTYDARGEDHVLPVFSRESVPTPLSPAARLAAQNEAVSYAAYRVITTRFANSPGAERTLFDARWLMTRLGYDPDFTSTIGNSSAAVGNRIGQAVLDQNYQDGANEAGHYADATDYHPVNEPLIVALPGSKVGDPNRWQPLALSVAISQNGIPIADGIQKFVGSNALVTTPFALPKPTRSSFTWDPGPPPLLGTATTADYQATAMEVIRYSSELDPEAGNLVDVSPGVRLNNPLGANSGTGHPINPTTGKPYASNIVNLGDYGRIMAEYWADGPDSETPPGHWNVLLNEVVDDPLFDRRVAGTGPELSALEWDVRAYLALNGAMHDAACAAWGLKHLYDSARPITMIRYLGERGQSSDPTGPSYDPLGLPLEAGLVEVITAASSAPGERHSHLADHVGEIALRAWKGKPADTLNQIGGVGWIRAVDWVPYQLDTFVTPAFPGYVSGHSTFSRAGAEVLTLLTGSAYFPGGISEQHFAANSYLDFEKGPSQDVTLQWATYYDAADQAGRSRLWGGIHIAPDDTQGRHLGARIGLDAYLKTQELYRGDSGAHGLFNLSTRGRVGQSEGVMVAGFVVAPQSGNSPALLRVVGPTLANFGVPLAECDNDPELLLFRARSNTPILTNDDWQQSPESGMIATRAAEVGAFALPPASRDAATLASLQSGAYTITNQSHASPESIALTEVYAEGLVNLSSRGAVGVNNGVVIAGFVLVGNEPATVLIRGVGPTLAEFGLTTSLDNPTIEVYRQLPDGGTERVARNDDWSDDPTASLTIVAGQKAGAFPLPENSLDAAVVRQLPSGSYTVVVTGANDSEGVALVEIYHLK